MPAKLTREVLRKQIKYLEQEIEQLQNINKCLREDIVYLRDVQAQTWKEAFTILVKGKSNND